MNIWSVLNTLVLVLGIGFWMYAVSNNIIHAVKDEYRKTSEHEYKLLDKWLDKVGKSIVDVFRELKKIDKGEDTNKPIINIDDIWKDNK